MYISWNILSFGHIIQNKLLHISKCPDTTKLQFAENSRVLAWHISYHCNGEITSELHFSVSVPLFSDNGIKNMGLTLCVGGSWHLLPCVETLRRSRNVICSVFSISASPKGIRPSFFPSTGLCVAPFVAVPTESRDSEFSPQTSRGLSVLVLWTKIKTEKKNKNKKQIVSLRRLSVKTLETMQCLWLSPGECSGCSLKW